MTPKRRAAINLSCFFNNILIQKLTITKSHDLSCNFVTLLPLTSVQSLPWFTGSLIHQSVIMTNDHFLDCPVAIFFIFLPL